MEPGPEGDCLNIPDVPNEKVMVGEDALEVNGPNLL